MTITPTVPQWMTHQAAAHTAVSQAMNDLLPAVHAVGALLIETFAAGGHVWTFGNGGSAADAQHFSGELIGHYRRDRRPLPCLTLGTDWTVSSCTANDYSFADVFARQVAAVSRSGDVICAFTTSGRSPNVVKALTQAKANGAITVLFGGDDGGPSRPLADHALLAPARDTARIQEMHTLMLHLISEQVDAWAAGEEPTA